MRQLSKVFLFGTLAALCGGEAFALPVCPPVPGSQFSQQYNLFDSLLTGPAGLKALSSCESAGIEAGGRYELVAEFKRFRIFNERDFFEGRPSLIRVEVPGEGDYVTGDTCQSPVIDSRQLISAAKHLNVAESTNGIVTIQFGNERCQLKECPKFGSCD